MKQSKLHIQLWGQDQCWHSKGLCELIWNSLESLGISLLQWPVKIDHICVSLIYHVGALEPVPI